MKRFTLTEATNTGLKPGVNETSNNRDAPDFACRDSLPPVQHSMQFAVEHIGLASRDPSALKDWYVAVLAAQLVFDNGQKPPAYLLSLPGGLLLEIYAGGAPLAETGDNSLPGWRHLALRVESIETARPALEAKGVRFPDPIKPAGGGGRVLFFRDIEGNLLHLVERTKDSAIH